MKTKSRGQREGKKEFWKIEVQLEFFFSVCQIKALRLASAKLFYFKSKIHSKYHFSFWLLLLVFSLVDFTGLLCVTIF